MAAKEAISTPALRTTFSSPANFSRGALSYAPYSLRCGRAKVSAGDLRAPGGYSNSAFSDLRGLSTCGTATTSGCVPGSYEPAAL